MGTVRARMRQAGEAVAVLAGLWVLFNLAFLMGTHPIRLIGSAFQWLTNLTWAHVSHELLRDFLVFGVIAGAGGFAVYVPNILLLFFASHLIRESNLHWRAAALFDPLLRPFGLRGESCVPMLFGFGCTVNAIHDARGIRSRRVQLVTMLVAPFMSCGAKFGVYILLVSALFTASARGTVLWILYLSGLTGGLLSALVLNRVLREPPGQAPDMPFEPVRRPRVGVAAKHALLDGWGFVRTAGLVIVAATVVLWAASSVPGVPADRYAEAAELARAQGTTLPARHTLSLYNSALARFGRLVQPAFAPLGFDWRATVAVVGGLTGRGVVISMLHTFFGMQGSPHETNSLASVLRETGMFTSVSAWSFMVFILLSGGCLAAVTMFFRHTRSVRLTAVFVVYPLCVAWLAALVVYQAGRLLFT